MLVRHRKGGVFFFFFVFSFVRVCFFLVWGFRPSCKNAQVSALRGVRLHARGRLGISEENPCGYHCIDFIEGVRNNSKSCGHILFLGVILPHSLIKLRDTHTKRKKNETRWVVFQQLSESNVNIMSIRPGGCKNKTKIRKCLFFWLQISSEKEIRKL